MAPSAPSASVGGPSKRPSRVILSDDEEEDHPSTSANGSRSGGATPGRKPSGRAQSKRIRSDSPSSHGDSDLDMLDSDDEPQAGKGRNGKGKGKERAGLQNGRGAADDEEEEEMEEPERRHRPEYQRGEDGYVSGSVVRIKLINFMTYDHVEFRPGPHLNMILGPNGTGKSTVAAGIAIGLGFHQRVMGRATELKSYVKQGCEEAQVEIELKAFPKKKNPIIWRGFSKRDDKSEWRLNNEVSTKKAVAAIVTDFGIQANNLCCFLAQDKVAEFAQMDPNLVLTETMRSAGDPRLSKWYEQLVELGRVRKNIEATFNTSRSERDTLQNQVNQLAPDVQHYEERAGLEIEKNNLTCLVLAAHRASILRERYQMEQVLAAQEKEKAQLNHRAEPITKLQDSFAKKVKKAEDRLKNAQQACTDADKAIQDSNKRITTKEDAISDLNHSLRLIKESIVRDAKLKQTYQNRIKEAQAILDEPVEDVTAQMAQLSEGKRRSTTAAQAASKQVRDLRRQYDEMDAQREETDKAVKAKMELHKRLSSIQDQREQAAADSDPSLAYVLKWLSEHEDEFEEKVCKPPMISVNVRDKRFCAQVEGATNRGQRSTFIVQNINDYNRLLQLNKHRFPAGGVRARDGSWAKQWGAGPVRLYISQVTVNEANCNPKKLCDDVTLRGLGFDGWASDFVEAEAPVIAFLNDRCGFANVAITLGKGDDIDTTAVQRVNISKWITSHQICSGTRSRYGRQDVSHNFAPLGRSVAFNLTVDTEGVQKLVDELTVLKRRSRDLEEPLEALRLDGEKAQAKLLPLQKKTAEAEAEMERLRAANVIRHKAGERLQKAQSDLAAVGRTDYEAQRNNLRAQRMSNLKDRFAILEEAETVRERCLNAGSALATRVVELAQHKVDYEVIKAEVADVLEAVRDIEKLIGESRVFVAQNTAAEKVLVEKLQIELRKLDGNDEIFEARVRDTEAPPDDPDGEPLISKDDVVRELHEVRARLDLSVGIDAAVVERYNMLKARLEKMKERAEKEGKDLEITNRKINKISVEFDPALDDLVSQVNEKFSAAFDYIRCSGEIRVNRAPEAFEDWGIDIRVAFRDGMALTQLTGLRQSGGERSFTTISYLMSLTGMARTPFSLVDEINQGMDATRERQVHEQLVNASCGSEAGQYFLITPKLLTGLRYHPKMKILNVSNGVWLPPPAGRKQKWSDFKSCINKYRTVHGMA